jgi:tRNA U34 2-thiouridine synthase MnmA/TrmU
VRGAAGRHSELDVELAEAFDAAAPGQAAVLLAGEAIVGHGTIVSGVSPMAK